MRVIVLTLIRKAKKFSQKSWFEKIGFLPVWLLLGISRMVILMVPFKHLAPWLGMQSENAWVPLIDDRHALSALSISRIVSLASSYTPWCSNCFSEALTARILLGLYRVPYGFYFGISRDTQEATLKAHAWVASGRIPVTGGAGFGDFKVVGCFVALNGFGDRERYKGIEVLDEIRRPHH